MSIFRTVYCWQHILDQGYDAPITTQIELFASLEAAKQFTLDQHPKAKVLPSRQNEAIFEINSAESIVIEEYPVRL